MVAGEVPSNYTFAEATLTQKAADFFPGKLIARVAPRPARDVELVQ